MYQNHNIIMKHAVVGGLWIIFEHMEVYRGALTPFFNSELTLWLPYKSPVYRVGSEQASSSGNAEKIF